MEFILDYLASAKQSGEYLLSKKDCLSFLIYCSYKPVKILGINLWFRNEDMKLIQDPGDLDLSEYKGCTATKAFQFVNSYDNKGKEYFYSIIFEN